MYKGASQSLQRAHAVDKPHPSRGFIDGGSDPHDVLPDIQRMSLATALDEKRYLQLQVQRLEQELVAAKRARPKDIPAICDQKVSIQERLKLVNARIKEINIQVSGDTLSQAIKDIVDYDTAGRIFARAKELRLASVGRNPEGQDRADGLGRNDEHATRSEAQGDAQC